MAYTQQPGGIRPGAFAEIAKVAKFVKDGGTIGGKKQVQSYDVSTGKTSSINVVEGSASDKVANELGNVVNFGKSVSQKKSSTTGKLKEGTNTNVMAGKGRYGKLPAGYKGIAFNRNNKMIDFKNNNQDKLRDEDYRL
jgi:hypothetical protein